MLEVLLFSGKEMISEHWICRRLGLCHMSKVIIHNMGRTSMLRWDSCMDSIDVNRFMSMFMLLCENQLWKKESSNLFASFFKVTF